jgi:hypothetical protein
MMNGEEERIWEKFDRGSFQELISAFASRDRRNQRTMPVKMARSDLQKTSLERYRYMNPFHSRKMAAWSYASCFLRCRCRTELSGHSCPV